MTAKVELKDKIIKSAKKIKALFLDLIFPIECVTCSKEGDWLCHECLAKLKINKNQSCFECGRINGLGQFCLSCQEKHYLDGVWPATSYKDEAVAKLIKNYKYYFAKDIALDLLKILFLYLDNLLIDYEGLINGRDIFLGNLNQPNFIPQVIFNFNNNLIVSVPLYKKRQNMRGFNQSEIIAKVIAKKFDWPISNSLIRTRNTKPQIKLSGNKRKENVKDCFNWQAEDRSLEGKNVILVDDIITTGATLNECAKVLKQKGALEVWGMVIARG